MFNGPIAMTSLALICRKLGTMLASGVEIRRAFDIVAQRTPDQRARAALAEVHDNIRRGHDVTSGMRSQGKAFPPLMIDMVEVGEKTGALPEILKSLAGHYDNLIRLRRSFVQAIAWPVFQLVAAILVIALLILVLGFIAESRGGEPIAILPFGLHGTTGAVIWLVACFGTIGAMILGYVLVSRSVQGRKVLHPLLLRLPVVGECMRNFAVARFSWAFSLTQNSGMDIRESIEASLNATGNGAYSQAIPRVWYDLRSGDPLSDALAKTQLFPAEYLEMVRTAEESGTVPEMLDHLSPQFEEDARRSLKMLTSALAWGVWLLVAIFIIILIFRVASIYLGALQGALDMAR